MGKEGAVLLVMSSLRMMRMKTRMSTLRTMMMRCMTCQLEVRMLQLFSGVQTAVCGMLLAVGATLQAYCSL